MFFLRQSLCCYCLISLVAMREKGFLDVAGLDGRTVSLRPDDCAVAGAIEPMLQPLTGLDARCR